MAMRMEERERIHACKADQSTVNIGDGYEAAFCIWEAFSTMRSTARLASGSRWFGGSHTGEDTRPAATGLTEIQTRSEECCQKTTGGKFLPPRFDGRFRK